MTTAKRESLTSSAYARVRADILTGKSPPGQRVNILACAETLAVSPGAVREALSRLTSEGLVHAEPQRGFRVTEISLADLRQLTEARVALETLVVQRSILLGDVAWEAGVVAAHHALARTRTDGGEAWAHAHAHFHEAIVAACDNPYFLDMRRSLYAKSERYRRLSEPLGHGKRNVPAEHRKIVAAVIARDGARAAQLLGEHVEATTEILVRGLFPEETKQKKEPRRRAG